MKLIVGLGNPGKEYENTRHNIGFMVLDYYFVNHSWDNDKSVLNMMNNIESTNSWQTKYNAYYKIISINNKKIIFVKPVTYMNLSGNAIIKFVQFYKINPRDILVIHDDLDLPFGKIRMKLNSSSGGHNGIKSIIENLGTQEFGRLKIGIANNKNMDTKDYVLGHLSQEETQKIKNILPKTTEIINDFISYDIKKAIDIFNQKNS